MQRLRRAPRRRGRVVQLVGQASGQLAERSHFLLLLENRHRTLHTLGGGLQDAHPHDRAGGEQLAECLFIKDHQAARA